MFVAITKLVLQTKKEQQKRVAEQPTERIRLDSKGGKSKTGKKGCCWDSLVFIVVEYV